MLGRATLAAALAASLGIAGLALAGEVKSGLNPGDVPQAFNVRNVTGQVCKGLAQDKRDVLCYR